MKRAALFRLLQSALLVAAGWAGWHLGQAKTASITSPAATALRQTEPVSPSPPLAPDGWSRHATPRFARPDFGNDTLAGRAHDDPQTVVAEVMSRPAGPERNEAIASLLKGWVARDPLAAAEWLAALAPWETPEMPFASLEPAFAQASAEARTKGLLGFLAAKVSPALLDLAAEGPLREGRGQPPDRGMANHLHDLTDSLAIWAAREPAAALAWARARPTPEARRWLLGEMVGALARNGAADQAIAFYNTEDDLHETGAVRMLGESWARADPAAAFTWAGTLPDAGLRDVFVSTALRTISTGQAPAMLTLTASVTDPEERQQLREALFGKSSWNQSAIREWIETDPALDDEERRSWLARLENQEQAAQVRNPGFLEPQK